MFAAAPDLSSLRQGDILANLPYPLISPLSFTAIGTYHSTGGNGSEALFKPLKSKHREDPDWLTLQNLWRLGFAAVVSQCCDLAPRNGRILLPTIALARLVPITAKTLTDPEKLASLRANKDPRDSTDPGVIKLFCLGQHEKLGAVEWTVDYNQLFSIPAAEYPDILENKVLEMTEDARIRFKIKLAWCLGRLTDEELAVEHPWIKPAGPEATAAEPNQAGE